MLPLVSQVAVHALTATEVLQALGAWAARASGGIGRRLGSTLADAVRAGLHRRFGHAPLHQLDGSLAVLEDGRPSLLLAACDHLAEDLLYTGRRGPCLRQARALHFQRVVLGVAPDHLWAAHLTGPAKTTWLRASQISDLIHGPLLPDVGDPTLAELKREGLPDLHRHFNGSALPGLLWSRLMTAGCALPSMADHSDAALRHQVDVARRLRSLLIEWVLRQHTVGTAWSRTMLRTIVEPHLLVGWQPKRRSSVRAGQLQTDPAARLPGSEGRPLFAERALLLHIFQRLRRPSGPTADPWAVAAAHAYLCIRNRVQSALSQPAEDAIGLDRFEARFRSHPLRDPAEEELKPAERLVQAYRVGGVHWLEARMTPKGSPANKMRTLLDAADARRQQRPTPVLRTPGRHGKWADSHTPDYANHLPALGFVFHFIRRPPKPLPAPGAFDRLPQDRHAPLRRAAAARARALQAVLADRDLAPFFVGLDVAGVEIDAPLDVFAPAIRALRAASGPRQRPLPGLHPGSIGPGLAVTCHAGEEFHHLLGGLRAIDEALTFLEMRPGDRIGHGLAAGLDVEQWAAARGGEVALSAGTRLDDLVWFRATLASMGRFAAVSNAVDDEIDERARMIYGAPVSWRDLHRAWNLRPGGPPSPLKSNNSLNLLLGGLPRPRKTTRGTSSAQATQAETLHGRYIYNVGVHRRRAQIVRVACRSQWATAITAAQNHMLQKLVERRVAIEVNPTSNLAIAHIDHLRDHPIHRWCPADGRGEGPRPAVVICTDNPGVWSTELIHEYAFLARSAETRGVEPQRIAAWLRDLRHEGLRFRFIAPP